MSLGEILDVLVSKARLEAEDAQRVLLGALNGLAALMLLENGAAQTAMAIKTYREVQFVCLSVCLPYICLSHWLAAYASFRARHVWACTGQQ